MKKYFMIIGVLTLIGFFIAAIFEIVEFVKIIKEYGPIGFLDILRLAAFVFVGPSLGLLFISHSRMIDDDFNKPHSSLKNTREPQYRETRSGRIINIDNSSTLSPLERAEKITEYQKQLEKGTITLEQYNKLVEDIDKRS